MNAKWLIPLLIITAIAPIAIYFYNGMLPTYQKQKTPIVQPAATIQFQQPNLRMSMEPGAQFGIVSMQIVDGYKFFLQLDNGERIEAHLTSATKNEATPFVIDLYQNNSQPSVILYRKVENYWIVDMQLSTRSGRQSLVKILQQQGLAY